MIILQLNYWWKSTTFHDFPQSFSRTFLAWKSTTFQDAWKLCTVHLTIVCIIIIIISSKEQ